MGGPGACSGPWHFSLLLSINQSINQSINYTSIAPISPANQAQWRTSQASVQKQKCKLQSEKGKRQQAIGCAGIYGGKAKSKRCVSSLRLKAAVEGAERTGRGNLLHRMGLAERKALAPVLVLTPGTERIIPLCHLSERAGIDGG